MVLTSSCSINMPLLTSEEKKVSTLIEEGKYEDALSIIEKNPDSYTDIIDEVKYNVALSKIEDKDYESAIELLDGNPYKQAFELLNEAKYNLAVIYYDNKEYDKAIPFLDANSYGNSMKLLNEINNLQTAIEIEKQYLAMLQEIDDYNPNEWIPDFDYMDGSDFYLRINNMLNYTYDILEKDNNLDWASASFEEIFGYKPQYIASAKSAIKDLQKKLEFDTFYASPFYDYMALHYVMGNLTVNSEYVRSEMTETSGCVIIERPYQFLKKNRISAKTFAYLLGTCKDFGGTVERDAEKITITFVNTEYGYSPSGYYYCAPNSQHDKIFNFYNNFKLDAVDAYITPAGLEVTYELTNYKQYDIKYLSINLILSNKYETHVSCASNLIKNFDDRTITFTVLFRDTTIEDLPDSEYGWYYFLAAVMNE